MTGLVAVLWAIYISECWVRWQPGDWVFRPTRRGAARGIAEPDVSFLGERVEFVWTSLLPGSTVHVFSGSALDARRCRDLLADIRRRTRALRLFCTALFAILMIAFPALVLTERLLPLLPVFLTVFAVTWAGTLATFFTSYRRLEQSSPALETWLVLALSPLSLIRAPDVITLHAARSSHPVAGADALCGDEEFLRICRLWHFDAPDLRPAIEELADRRGLRQRLLAPPPAVEASMSRFCERCHATFNDTAVECADCKGVSLTPLPANACAASA